MRLPWPVARQSLVFRAVWGMRALSTSHVTHATSASDAQKWNQGEPGPDSRELQAGFCAEAESEEIA